MNDLQALKWYLISSHKCDYSCDWLCLRVQLVDWLVAQPSLVGIKTRERAAKLGQDMFKSGLLGEATNGNYNLRIQYNTIHSNLVFLNRNLNISAE